MIKKLEANEIMNYVDILTKAYPGMMSTSEEVKQAQYESFKKRQEEDPSVDIFGLFRDNQLVGGMRLHHYQMNLFSKWINVGGVGLVAVDLMHKKEKVAKELMEHFLRLFLNKGDNMVMLYPFRPDFYKKMGFGYGPKMHQHRISPSSFPNQSGKSNLRMLTIKDKEDLQRCSTRYAAAAHGMCLKTEAELENGFKNPDITSIGYFENGEMKGYVSFSFKKLSENNVMHIDLIIKELIAETKEALSEICSFMYSQSDQINQIVWNTQEENLHFLLDDPRNGSHHIIPSVYHETHHSGVGLMYRIINTRGILHELENHNFNGANVKCKLDIKDSFLPENNQKIIVHVTNGALNVVEKGEYEVTLTLDVSELSSLLMGTAGLKELYHFSKLELSDPAYLQELHQMFYVMDKPKCFTAF